MRHRWLGTGLVLAAVLLVLAGTVTVLTGNWSEDPCAPVRSGSEDSPHTWTEVSGLAIGFGYDSIPERSGDLPAMVTRVDGLDPAAVSVSAGRADWLTFPWEGHRADWSQPQRASSCDLLGRALDALGTRTDGSRRARIIVVDTFVPSWIEDDPSIAGVSVTGRPSTLQASVSQLESGRVGDAIVALVAEVAARYRPEAVSLTELFAVTTTFGSDDLESYRAFSGSADWPRTDSGEIDQGDPSIAAWRSHVIAGLVTRARAAANASGVDLLMEVRVNWADPTAGRPFSGQDYDLLLQAADQLVSWDYFALEEPPADTEPAVRAREERWPGRWVSSVGLWGQGDAIPAPEDVGEAVEGSFRGGAQVVWVTPEARFSEEQWQVLAAIDPS